MTKYLLISPLLVLLGTLLPWSRRRYLSSEHLVAQITPNRFRGLDDYVEDSPAFNPGPRFWESSRGLLGVLYRFREMTILVRILQCEVSNGRISRADASYAWRHALLQVWFSALSIPESLACLCWSDIPHVCGLFALRSHWHLSLSTATLCGSQDAPTSVMRLAELL